MTQWLDSAELVDLTGYRRYTAQRAWLDHNAIPFFVAASGRPIVLRSVFEPPEIEEETTPELLRDEPWRGQNFQSPRHWFEHNAGSMILPMTDVVARRKPYAEGCGCERAGVYFLFDGDELHYIGLSKIVANRLAQHRMQRLIPFDHWSEVEVPPMFVAEVERVYIRRETPPYNIKDVP